jgi:hypothetical protein
MRGFERPHVIDYSYVWRMFAMVLYVSGSITASGHTAL